MKSSISRLRRTAAWDPPSTVQSLFPRWATLRAAAPHSQAGAAPQSRGTCSLGPEDLCSNLASPSASYLSFFFASVSTWVNGGGSTYRAQLFLEFSEETCGRIPGLIEVSERGGRLQNSASRRELRLVVLFQFPSQAAVHLHVGLNEWK